MKEIRIYTDGGSRGNPGPAACAYVVYDGENVLFEEAKFLGTTTNNVAEYSGVLNAVEWCLISNLQSPISFYLDSELVVKQMRGEYMIKDEKLKDLKHRIDLKIRNLKLEISGWHHVPRIQNVRADLLVNQELDKHK